MKIEVLTERQARIVGCLALGVLPEALDDITALISDLTERLYSFPSPHDDAGADKGVPDAIKGYEQYPFAWHFGNIKVALETMECTGKLPNGCPNCKGLDFCTKRDALMRYAKMEQCWNFWIEDPHHG